MLFTLPLLNTILASRWGVTPLVRDLHLIRLLAVSLALGSLLFGLAFAPWVLVAGLVPYSAGQAFVPLCRAVLNMVVEPHAIATMYTAIAVVEQLALLVGAPIMSRLLRSGLDLDGGWIGLPYMVLCAMAVVMTAAVMLFRAPRNLEHS